MLQQQNSKSFKIQQWCSLWTNKIHCYHNIFNSCSLSSLSLLPLMHQVPNIAQAKCLSINVLSCLNKTVTNINVKFTDEIKTHFNSSMKPAMLRISSLKRGYISLLSEVMKQNVWVKQNQSQQWVRPYFSFAFFILFVILLSSLWVHCDQRVPGLVNTSLLCTLLDVMVHNF